MQSGHALPDPLAKCPYYSGVRFPANWEDLVSSVPSPPVAFGVLTYKVALVAILGLLALGFPASC
jgi:hypothetical protein